MLRPCCAQWDSPFPISPPECRSAAAGELAWTKTEFGLTNLKADVAGISLTGALDFGRQAPGRLTGSIAVDEMPALALFGLVLGAPEPAKAGSLWSSLAFAPAAFDLPNASIALTVKDMALASPIFPRGAAAKDARATLLTAPGLMDLQDHKLRCRRRQARRRNQAAPSRATFRSRAISISPTWRSTVPPLRGRMSGALDLAGTGKSADAVVASLAGSGRALISDLTIPRADPAAVARVFAAFDQDGHKLGADDVAAALASELKRADLKIKSGAFDIAVAAGVLHLSPATAPEKPERRDSPRHSIFAGRSSLSV